MKMEDFSPPLANALTPRKTFADWICRCGRGNTEAQCKCTKCSRERERHDA